MIEFYGQHWNMLSNFDLKCSNGCNSRYKINYEINIPLSRYSCYFIMEYFTKIL